MKKILIFLLIISGLYNHAAAQSDSLEYLLFELPDVIFKKIDPPKGYEKAYELLIKQKVDQTDPTAGYFYQKGFLSHKGFDRPTVMITE